MRSYSAPRVSRHASTPSTNSSRCAWISARGIGASGPAAGDRRVLRAREHVHLDAHASELAGELADVHVHPARLLAPEGGERAGVDGEHRDAERAARRHWILTAQTRSEEHT